MSGRGMTLGEIAEAEGVSAAAPPAPPPPSRWAPRAHQMAVSAAGAFVLWRAVELGHVHWLTLAILAALPLWAVTTHAAGRSFDLKTVRDIVAALRKAG